MTEAELTINKLKIDLEKVRNRQSIYSNQKDFVESNYGKAIAKIFKDYEESLFKSFPSDKFLTLEEYIYIHATLNVVRQLNSVLTADFDQSLKSLKMQSEDIERKVKLNEQTN